MYRYSLVNKVNDIRRYIGQEEVKGHLRRLLQENKLPHAIMFCGPKGAGKLPLALAYAQMLLCQDPTDEGA